MVDEEIDLSIFLKEYLNDARDGFQRANNALLLLEKDYRRMESLDEISRVIHTLKSSSSMIGFTDIAELAHSSEDLIGKMKSGEIPVTQESISLLFEIVDTLEQMVKERRERKSETSSELKARSSELKKKIEAVVADILTASSPSPLPPGERIKVRGGSEIEKIDTVRVHTSLLNSLFNLVGELIITKNRIDNILSNTTNKELKAVLSSMEHIITSLEENISAARLVPVDEIFQKFPRMVRDLALELHKEIDLVMEGSEIELDKAVLDAISEPLIHLLRNAVGHGIESAEERQKNKKNRRGTIRLIAKRGENHILIDVEDDGGGIDIPRMKEIAVRKGFIKHEESESLSSKDVIKILFSAGFSSVEKVTGLAGRGVGLDVVRTAAMKMGGTVEVTTEKGKGTKFSLTLPLTTAIVQTLLIGVGEHIFAIPSAIVLETQRIGRADIKDIGERQAFIRGEDVIPFVALDKMLGISHREDKEFIVVLIRRGERLLGLGVDAVLDQMDNIIKPFDPIAQRFKGFSGGTILGDGRVALLLDIPTLFGFETFKGERYSV